MILLVILHVEQADETKFSVNKVIVRFEYENFGKSN